MSGRRAQMPGSAGWLLCTLLSTAAAAHSASDAYMTLTLERSGANRLFVHGQWDIALRDLDFALKLDDDGDGRLTWGEVRRHQTDIERYAYRAVGLRFGPAQPCKVTPRKPLIDGHADGAYAALFFDADCTVAAAGEPLSLVYRLFFDIDPSHRLIVVVHDGADIATAVLSPQRSQIDLTRSASKPPPPP